MERLRGKSGSFAVLLFLIWPFLALVSAFRNYEKSWGKNVLWAFVAFYGFSFAIGTESQGSDIVRYVEQVKSLHHVNMTFSDALGLLQENGFLDIAQTLIALTISRLTDSQAIVTLVYGIIFGFFFSRNMWYVLGHLEGKLKFITIVLFTCFFLIIPIWDINGFRMWTAAHIFIYGLLPFLFEGKKKGLFISATAILIHFSFIVPLSLLLGYLVAGNRMALYFGFFLLTFFISEINIETFNRVVENYAPEIVQERTSDYRSENRVEEFRETSTSSNKRWYAVWYGRVFNWAIMGFLVILYFKGRDFFKEHKSWLRLYSFTLLFYGTANILSSLPSGGRFISVVQMSAVALIILYIQNRKQEVMMERFVWIATPLLLLFIVVSFRTGLYSMSATAVLGNPVIAFFLTGEHVSLNDVMRMIL